MDEALHIAVQRWLEKAANDLKTAETMLTVSPAVTDTSCFHAQQCMEKALKACLTLAGRHIEKTHSLPRLVELCSADFESVAQMADVAIDLTDYAVESRYPDDWREIPLSEAQAAVQKAGEVFDSIRLELSRRMGGAKF